MTFLTHYGSLTPEHILKLLHMTSIIQYGRYDSFTEFSISLFFKNMTNFPILYF